MGKAEHSIERLLHDSVKELGGFTFKFISPGRTGMPDRIVVLPNGEVHFVELKSEDGTVSKQQERMLRKLRGMGQTAIVIKGRFAVLNYLDDLRELMNE